MTSFYRPVGGGGGGRSWPLTSLDPLLFMIIRKLLKRNLYISLD